MHYIYIYIYIYISWRRKWQSIPVLPGESYGQRSLACYSPWVLKESDVTELLSTHTHTYIYTFACKIESLWQYSND